METARLAASPLHAGSPPPPGAASAPPEAVSSSRSRALAAGGVLAVALLALGKLALHLATTGAFGYGYFVDELYYLALADHLAWGFVDLPPLFPAIVALLKATLGDGLFALRLPAALAGAALVLMTGLLARALGVRPADAGRTALPGLIGHGAQGIGRLGGGRWAQGMAALAVVTAPIYLALHSIATMNAFEPLLWTGCAWVVVRLADGAHPRLWLLLGLLAGVGLLNKHSMAFFGVALAAGILATPLRAALRTRWPYLGAAVALAIWLPNLVWMAAHGFPHFEMLANIRANRRNVELSPLAFFAQQALMLHPVALPLWLAGLGHFLFGREGRRYRALGIAWLVLIGEMLLLDGRVYYPAPAYPMLFAGGAVAIERWLGARVTAGRLLRPAYAGLLAAGGLVLAPLFVPCLPPETFIRYARAIGMEQPRIENHRLGPLPQLFADRFGWPEMAEELARVYHRLPPAEREKTAVFGQNYGQAGAIDLFGPRLGLPKALSGHLAYHDWGPRGYTGESVIVLDDDPETLSEVFTTVERVGRIEHRYSMPYQHFDVYHCRGLKMPIEALWPRLRQLN